ncbi:hypothetical protein [Methylocella sp.]|jgi:hypothetical protein|uniref:hypothetical protein n=1 Tax=Methylocella sp. TaxID=1978226 RepID=UPI003C27217A
MRGEVWRRGLPSGKKVYVAQYRQNGPLPALEHRRARLPDARLGGQEAARRGRESGSDPIAQRRAAGAVSLFSEIADEFMRTHVAGKRKARTLEAYEILLRLHILPMIGALRVTDIRRGHISKLLAGLAEHLGAANRALSVIVAVWRRFRCRCQTIC